MKTKLKHFSPGPANIEVDNTGLPVGDNVRKVHDEFRLMHLLSVVHSQLSDKVPEGARDMEAVALATSTNEEIINFMCEYKHSEAVGLSIKFDNTGDGLPFRQPFYMGIMRSGYCSPPFRSQKEVDKWLNLSHSCASIVGAVNNFGARMAMMHEDGAEGVISELRAIVKDMHKKNG